MKRLVALAAFCAFSCGLHAQVIDTTVCGVLKNPYALNGKIVRIKGTVAAGFDQFIVKDGDCGLPVNAIWLAYPEGTKAKSGPVALVQLQPAKNFAGTVEAATRTPVTLDKSKDFKQFDNLLSTQHKNGAMCLGCNRYAVKATLVGRLDSVIDATMRRDVGGKLLFLGGFGNMNAYPARLVLQSVAEVTPQEADYSATDAASKSEAAATMGVVMAEVSPTISEMLETARKSGQALVAGGPFAAQINRAAGAFGKPGENNGVTILFKNPNEATAKSEAQGTVDSPDGVLFNCTFNQSRLEGDALTRAVIHVGNHVADIRVPENGSDKALLMEQEYRAWMTVVVDAVAGAQKTLTLPGGYLLWNSAWAGADRNTKADENLKKFLTVEESLGR